MTELERISSLNPENKELTVLKSIDYKDTNTIYKNLKKEFSETYNAGKKLIQENQTLNIGVVGQVKAGKSSFLNSLMFNGETILPKASTPMTAGLTVLRYSEEPKFEIEYYNQEEWNVFLEDAKTFEEEVTEYRRNEKSEEGSETLSDEEIAKICNLSDRIISAKEMVDKCGHGAQRKIKEKSQKEIEPFLKTSELQDKLKQYVGADGNFTSVVKNLVIYLNEETLKGVQIVDTPGVNDPIVSRENKTREYLQSCHGVFFLSYSGRFFDSTDAQFLTERIGNQGIGEVVVLASKYDSVLQDVGIKFEDDLPMADKDVQEKLRVRLQNSIPESYNRKDPLFDVTSGIGFSIANKNAENFDETESHVLKRMRHLYPSYFEGEDMKETFMSLSNIEPIKEKYLEGAFKKNKEQIIQEKTDNFIKESTKNIRKEIEKEIEKLDTKKEQLSSTDLEKLKAEKKSQEELFKSMESEIERIVKSIKISFDKFDISFKNKSVESFKIPVTSHTSSHKRPGWLGLRQDFSVSYPIVNPSELGRKLREQVSKKQESTRKEWRSFIDESLKKIQDEIYGFINKSESEDSSLTFKSNYYISLINETIGNFDLKTELDISNETNKIIDDIKTITNSQKIIYSPTHRQEGDDASDVKTRLKREADRVIQKIDGEVQEVLKGLREKLNIKMKNELEELKSKMDNLEDNFTEKIKENGKNYVNNLEEEIRDKALNLDKINTTLQTLKTLKQNL